MTFNKVESVFSFNLQNLTTSAFLLTSEPIPDDIFGSTVPITEGFKVSIEDITFAVPISYYSAEFTFDADSTDGDLRIWTALLGFAITDLWFDFGSPVPVPTIDATQVDLQFRFTGVAPDNDSPVTSGGSFSTQWERAAFGGDGTEANVQLRIPFELWDLEGNDGAGRQIEVAVINRNADVASPYGNDVGTASTARWRMSGRDYIIVINEDYADDPNKLRSIVNQNTTWLLFFQQAGASVWSTGDEFTLRYVNPIQAGIDVYHFQVPTELEVLGIAETFLLSQNYPNPFNPETTIRYSLPVQSDVKLLIYNLLGQEVFRFEIAGQKIGEYEVVWNGKNQRGNPLSSGLYIYKFSAGDFVQTKKMLLLK
ncbi:MAG: T9SS type A sorting domain-containing protein [Candidatus Marinimicrobia bacterium]|nr:T9SS type A sorting domain-containing protein [Candidatus Neomarinimicrobiota bacterium]